MLEYLATDGWSDIDNTNIPPELQDCEKSDIDYGGQKRPPDEIIEEILNLCKPNHP